MDIHEKKISGLPNKKCVEVETDEEKISLYIENSSSESSSDDILLSNQKKFVGLLPMLSSPLGPRKDSEDDGTKISHEEYLIKAQNTAKLCTEFPNF